MLYYNLDTNFCDTVYRSIDDGRGYRLMRRRTHRYIAFMCVCCMLLTGMPSSVLSDGSVATPTDLQPAVSEEQNRDPEPETPVTEEPGKEEPEAEDPVQPEAGPQKPESGKQEPAGAKPGKQKTEKQKPASGKPEKEKKKEETPGTTEPEKPKADRDLKIGDVLTISGKLEGKDYLVRFAPARSGTLYLILRSGQQLKATVTAEKTGKTKTFGQGGTDEDGKTSWTVAEYKVKKKQSYLVRITGPDLAEFTLRMVDKDILKKEQEADRKEESSVEEPGDEPGEEPAEKPAAQESGETPAEPSGEEPAGEPDGKTAEEPAEKPADEPGEQPAEKPVVKETGETPAETSVGESAGEPDGKTAEEPAEKSAETNPVEAPGEEPVGESGGEVAEEPADESVEGNPAEAPVEEAVPEREPDAAPGAESAGNPDGEPGTAPAEEPGKDPEDNPDGESGEEPDEIIEEVMLPEDEPAEEEPEAEPAAESGEEPLVTGEQPAEAETEESAAEPEAEPQPEENHSVNPDIPEVSPATPTDLGPEKEPVTEVRLDAADSALDAWIVFPSDAGISPDAELRIRELSSGEEEVYRAQTAQALNCDDESCLRYTRYLEFALERNGEALVPEVPVTAFVRLPDVEEGADVLQAVRFGSEGPVLLGSERMAETVSFSAELPGVFAIGNALMPLSVKETELATVEVLGFASGDPVSLSRAKDPEMAEGLEVLGTFTVKEGKRSLSSPAEREGLWIRAGLKEDAELDSMEGVALYRVENGQTDVLMEELTGDAQVMELDAGQVAVVRDTGYRHLTLTVNPEGADGDQTIILDGMIPKDAEAAAEDVTERFAGYVCPEDRAEKTRKGGNEEETPAERTTLAAFDISISDGNREYQPDEDRPISVEIVDSRIPADREIELWHIRDDGTEEKVEGITVEEGRIVFEATGFSVYVVVVHEDGTVAEPRVEFHFISRDDEARTDGTSVYYATDPWSFKNKDGKIQHTQILKDGETLELITDPPNLADKHFYGWYVVDPFVISGTTDEYGIGKSDSKLYYTWPANPDPISFEKAITVQEKNVSIGDTVHWSLEGVSGAGTVDRDGSLHVFLAPVYDKYNFINFMLYARDAGVQGASNVMTRKLIVMGSAPGIDIRISDIRSTSKDAVHLIFMGWEYNAGTEENPDWIQIPTVDYTGAEMKDPGRDGVYFTSDAMEEGTSIDLYPIFVEARWVDFVSGRTGSGATFIGSRFLESWGRNGVTPEGMEPKPGTNVFDPSIPTPERPGYEFEGWYAFAAIDQDTGEITNLSEPKDVIVSYVDDNLTEQKVTINTTAKKITNGSGTIIYGGIYTLDAGSGYQLFEGSGTSLKFYDALDRLTLYANWTPADSGITVVYWTENADDEGYASSAVKTLTTDEINSQLGTSYASGSEITLEGLQAYLVNSISILDTKMLDDVKAVPAGEEIFYDLNAERSDQSRIIDGEGNAIFNVYYSRKVFKLVFHIGRDGYVKTKGNQKTTDGWDGNWIEYMFNDPKITELGYPLHNTASSQAGLFTMTYRPTNRMYTSEYETSRQNVMGDYVPGADENVYVITAKYGAYIGDRWPTPVNSNFIFTEPRGSRYTMYTWAGYYGSRYCKIANDRPTWGGQQGNNPDLNGIYSYMSAELCSNREGTEIINANQVHHIVAYFGLKSNLDRYKQYHTLIEAKEGTYDPDNTVLVSGEDYAGYTRTTWSSDIAHVTSDVIVDKTFYEADGSPTEVISNVNPQFQMAWELDGYEYFYSCYNIPVQYENHVYFFYTPKQYTLTFMYENEADRKTDTYYYKQSLTDANKYEDPWKEGYRFLGWYTNEAGAGEPFDFANSTMPAQSLVLYPVFKKLYYVVRIDPNGAEIDHWRPASTSAGASTGFRVNYKETISAYNFLERNFLPTYDKEIQDLGLDPDTEIFYYLNTQYISEEHDGKFIPNALRNALYLTASQIDTYWAFYSSYPESDFAERDAVKFTSKTEWMDAYFGGHDLGSLQRYRQKQGAEHYSFMGWYQVMENGSVASAPFNFNTMITEDLEIRALWRLDGGYYILYNPTYTEDGTTVMGDVEQWRDPEDPVKLLYVDQSPTHILRAPSNITEGWVFRGWRVVRQNGTDWEPIQLDSAGEPVYYQPGDEFTVDSALASEIAANGAVIHMQACYERADSSSRRPDVTNLILDANEEYGGYVYTTDSGSLPALDRPGTSVINTEDHQDGNGRPTQILFGDIQSNTALHLYRYATDQTYNGVQGTEYFSNSGLYMLIGFDENADPLNPTTGKAYIPAFAADGVAAVTRDDEKTLYAMWEPMIYVSFVNTTAEPVTVQLGGTPGTETVRVVNMVTGEYDREQSTGTITIPAKNGDEDGVVKVVLPCAEAGVDVLEATAVNNHSRKRMSVSGEFRNEPCGTGDEDILYGGTVAWSSAVQFDGTGIVVTYTEVPDRQVLFDVNGGTWTETSGTYLHVDGNLYTIYERQMTDNQYQPADPVRTGRIFLGWTTNADIAAHTDFSSEEEVTWGGTTITPDAGSVILDKVRSDWLWDFSQDPPYDDTLYAVWSDTVTLTYNVVYSNNVNANPVKLHEWTGPETTEEEEPYVFFRSASDRRYITYTVAKGEKAIRPEDPTAHSDRPTWNFVAWLVQGGSTDSYRYNAKEPGDDVIRTNTFDFSQRLHSDETLVTSWTTSVKQYYTFTVENHVVDGKPDDTFTFHIDVLDELVYGKISANATSNELGEPAEHWGSASMTLKNNQQYTVRVTVSFIDKWGGVYGVEIEVIDEDGTLVKDGQVIYCIKNTYKNYVADYKYTLKISQDARIGYTTAVDAQVTGGRADCGTNQEERAFTFISCKNTNAVVQSAFSNQQNTYTAGEDNRIRVIFTNTGEPVVAPTAVNLTVRPFVLMMLTGILLAAGACAPGVLRKRGRRKHS